MQTKAFDLEIKARTDTGVFEGYGAVFGNQDLHNETIAAGAFAGSLKTRRPALLWQHRADEPIGAFEDVREDGRGLAVKGRLALNTTRGKEAYELLGMGALTGLSVGFIATADRVEKGGRRTITQADLYEISLVTFPANESARVSSVKAAIERGDVPSIRDLEALLRDAGLSRKQSQTLLSKGYAGLDPSRDAADPELIAALRKLNQTLAT